MKKIIKIFISTSIMMVMVFSFFLTSISASSGIWTTKESMPSVKHYFGTAELNGIIYTIGGQRTASPFTNTVEAYDTISNTWSTKASLPSARGYISAAAVNGKIYAIGGVTVNTATKLVEMYDPATNTWTRVADMIAARSLLSVAVYNGKIYAFGGSATTRLASVEMYDPITNTWTSKASMPTSKSDSSTAVVNGKIYLIGGIAGSTTLTVHEYDPILNTWTAKQNMPGIRYGHRSVTMNGKVYVFGGTTSTGFTASVWEYDPVNNSWSTKTDIPTPRRFLGGESVNGKIYAIGGQYNLTTLDTVEAFTLDSPLTPTNLSANVVTNQVHLSWPAVFGAESYNIKRSLTQGGPYTPIATGINTINFTDTNVNRGVTYYYVLTASNVIGDSGNSNEATSTLSPIAPVDLVATSGNAKVDLSWTGSLGATAYNIKRSTIDGGPHTPITSNVLTTTFEDTTVTNGLTYYYVVTALNTGGESGVSNQVIGLPQVPIPAIPKISSIAASDSQISINWNSVGLADSYNIKRSTIFGGTYTTIASNITSGYIDTTIANGFVYFYKISAVNAGGESGNSNTVAAMYSLD